MKEDDFSCGRPRKQKRGSKALDVRRGKCFYESGSPISPGPITKRLVKRSKALAAVCRVGGLLADKGWIRVFGTGHEIPNLEEWNSNADVELDGEPAYYVAADVVGGLFLLAHDGIVYYFRPDTAELERAAPSYDDLLDWILGGDHASFYGRYRFSNWERATMALRPDWSFTSSPPLWKKGGLAAFRKQRDVIRAYPDLRAELIDAIESKARAGSKKKR